MKSESDANLFKKSGNELYLKSRYSEALIEYNKALCHADTDELKSLLYGNRSAVYFEVKRYSLCLVNIQLAIQHGYPQEKLVHLKAREEKCKQLLSAGSEVMEDDQKVSEFFKLSNKSHPKIPFIIDGIELKNSKKYGNHLITNRDLKTGDIIAIESTIPFLSWLSFDYCYENCAFCLRQNFYNLIPCDDSCCDTMYCSESCKSQFHTIHRDKLGFGVDNSSEDWFETSHRVLVTAYKEFDGEEEFEKFMKDQVKLTIFDVDELSTKNILAIFCSMAQAKNQKKFCSKELLEETSDINNLLHQVVSIYLTNSVSFERVIYEDEDTCKVQKVGHTVLLFGSLFSHSCDANVHRIVFGNKVVFYVGRPIKAGEQLFVHYVAAYEIDPYEARQMHLRSYDISCDCDACKSKYPLLNDLRKLHKFNEPELKLATVDEAIDTLKKSCKLITKFKKDHPCYETTKLMIRNYVIMTQIARLEL